MVISFNHLAADYINLLYGRGLSIDNLAICMEEEFKTLFPWKHDNISFIISKSQGFLMKKELTIVDSTLTVCD